MNFFQQMQIPRPGVFLKAWDWQCGPVPVRRGSRPLCPKFRMIDRKKRMCNIIVGLLHMYICAYMCINK